jgi:hypothetical protein
MFLISKFYQNSLLNKKFAFFEMVILSIKNFVGACPKFWASTNKVFRKLEPTNKRDKKRINIFTTLNV